MYSCTFIGHSKCSQNIKNVLYKAIERLIVQEQVDTFYVGTQGQFDMYVYSVLCQLEGKYNIHIKVVLAYLNSKVVDVYYDMDKTIFPEVLVKTPVRFAISRRNLYMIEQSQYMVCYINNTFTRAYTFAEKSKKLGLKITNLGELRI